MTFIGDTDGDWVCDCRPAFIFDPKTGVCFEAFTRGPCKPNEIFVLNKTSPIPVCQKNNCPTGKVSFKNKCSKIESEDGCDKPKKLKVSATTLQLECIFMTSTRFDESLDEGIHDDNKCYTGGKRAQQNLCPENVKPE